MGKNTKKTRKITVREKERTTHIFRPKHALNRSQWKIKIKKEKKKLKVISSSCHVFSSLYFPVLSCLATVVSEIIYKKNEGLR